MKLISWNVNGRVKDGPEQVQALSRQEPHVVALQDIREAAVAEYERAFAKIGLYHMLHTLQDASDSTTPTGVLIASCFELSRLPPFLPTVLRPEGFWSPDPEKVIRHWTRRTLFVTFQSPWGRIDLYNAYITPGNHKETTSSGRSSYPWIKWDLFSGIYHAFAVPTDRLRILCGDFNTPQEEKQTGEVITWGYDKKKGNYRLTRPDQDKVERSVLQGLVAYDLTDAYRRVHGYENCGSEETFSWRTYRYDHIFASQALYPQSVHYLQEVRQLRLSDHVPIEVVFDLKNDTKAIEETTIFR